MTILYRNRFRPSSKSSEIGKKRATQKKARRKTPTKKSTKRTRPHKKSPPKPIRESTDPDGSSHGQDYEDTSLPPLLSQDLPELSEDCRIGLSGRILEMIEPCTEAHPAAILGQLLVVFGNAVGSGPRLVFGGADHPPRLFLLLVGRTSRARKGTSLGIVRELMNRADHEYSARSLMGGGSTGEGIIKALEEMERDPRICLLEEEFSCQLSRMMREGNTFSETIRQAFDRDSLNVLTRKDPLRVNNVHFSIVGHITQDELHHQLRQVQLLNGFANRFLWLLVDRTKLLCHGQCIPNDVLDQLGNQIGEALHKARLFERMAFHKSARPIWEQFYKCIATGDMGPVEPILSRAEVIVPRLAMAFAMLDQGEEISPEHLKAAIGFWRYAEESVHLMFGEYCADPLVERIYTILKFSEDGLSRTELSRRLGGHKQAEEIKAALEQLKQEGRIDVETERGKGRPKQTIHAKLVK